MAWTRAPKGAFGHINERSDRKSPVRSSRHRLRATIIVAAAAGVIAVLGLTADLASHPNAARRPPATAPIGHSPAATQISSVTPTFVPSCSWAMWVSGTASPEQAGLLRCYLRALARRSRADMLAVAYRVIPAGSVSRRVLSPTPPMPGPASLRSGWNPTGRLIPPTSL